MSYIGKKPTPAPLKSSDIADGIITTAKIVDANITTAKINNDAVTVDKLNLISTGSVPSLEAKGTSGVTEGYIQLNCAENSHGIKLKSPPHSAGASYTLTFPNNDGDANQFLQTDGSGVLSFASATPADGSISTAKIADDAVTLAKMANGTDGNIISYDTSGNPVAVATGSSGQVLTSAGAGAVPSFQDAGGGDFVLIKTQTVVVGNSIANVDFVHGTSSVIFDGTYKSYKFILRNYRPANDVDIYAQVMISGTVQTSGYITRNRRSYHSGGEDGSNLSSVIAFGNYGIGTATNQSVGYGEFMCGNPTFNGYPEMMSHHSGGENGQKVISMCSGKLQTTTSNWNGVRFKCSDGGNFGGEISLYGIKG